MKRQAEGNEQADLEAVGRRIGHALGKYPAAAIVNARVQTDDQGRAQRLDFTSELNAGRKAYRQKGAYLLRTNCEETDPAQLWQWYILLVQAEAAFRTAKSDLGLRPIFHQKKERVHAHVLVCFLKLALWRTLEQRSHAKGLDTSSPEEGTNALSKLGVNDCGLGVAYSAKGAWAMALHWVMQQPLKNKTLKRHGFILPW